MFEGKLIVFLFFLSWPIIARRLTEQFLETGRRQRHFRPSRNASMNTHCYAWHFGELQNNSLASDKSKKSRGMKCRRPEEADGLEE